jgi:hypothetical protein
MAHPNPLPSTAPYYHPYISIPWGTKRLAACLGILSYAVNTVVAKVVEKIMFGVGFEVVDEGKEQDMHEHAAG